MATKHKLVYLAEAEVDILSIVKFHAEKVSPESARRIYQTIREGLMRLREYPLLGAIHPDPELTALGYRRMVLNQTYVAVYKVMDDTVLIYRIVNGATDYPRLLK